MAVFEERSVPKAVMDDITQWLKDHPHPTRRVTSYRLGDRKDDPYYVRIDKVDKAHITALRRYLARHKN